MTGLLAMSFRVIGLVQRVARARVTIAGEVAGQIGPGLLLLLCAERGDGDALVDRLLAKVLKLRIMQQIGDHYKACPLPKALELLDYRWDNYFQYNVGGE